MKKLALYLITFICVGFIPATALAEIPEKIDFIDKMVTFVSEAPAWIAVGGAALMEMIFRLVKSKKPLSIMHLIAAIFHQVSAFLKAVGDFLDKILPQRTEQ